MVLPPGARPVSAPQHSKQPQLQNTTENSLTRMLTPPKERSPTKAMIQSVSFSCQIFIVWSFCHIFFRPRIAQIYPQPSLLHFCSQVQGARRHAQASHLRLLMQAALMRDPAYAQSQDEAGLRWTKKSGFTSGQIRDFQVCSLFLHTPSAYDSSFQIVSVEEQTCAYNSNMQLRD